MCLAMYAECLRYYYVSDTSLKFEWQNYMEIMIPSFYMGVQKYVQKQYNSHRALVIVDNIYWYVATELINN